MLNNLHGNRALLKVNGNLMASGTVQNVRATDDFGIQDVDGLGEAEAVELVPGKVTHTISFERFFVYNKNLRALGFVPSSDQYLLPPNLDIEIIDKVSGETVEHYTGGLVATHGRSIGKHVLSVEDVTVRCRHKEV